MDSWHYRPAGDSGLSPAERRRSLRRESGTGEWLAQQAWWLVARAYLSLAHRFRVEGRERLPAEPPFIVVANHTSHLDALALLSMLPAAARGHAFPLAAGDTFFRTPTAAAFSATLLNALPMWRTSCGPHALETLRERLVGERLVYVLFPEGTRSRDGRLGPFHAGLGRLVAGTAVPVVPCSIRGAFDAWPAHERRPRRGRVRVCVGEPLSFHAMPDDRGGWDGVADCARRAVSALLDG
jgi:1-acyl-sn-glycerol-3-phosphate acyltransferase